MIWIAGAALVFFGWLALDIAARVSAIYTEVHSIHVLVHNACQAQKDGQEVLDLNLSDLKQAIHDITLTPIEVEVVHREPGLSEHDYTTRAASE